MNIPRGIHNNNPGNIRKSPAAWKGKIGDDGVFEIFDTSNHGIRALMKVLQTYRNLYNLDTIRKIISQYAPNTENNTEAYILAVSNICGRSSDFELPEHLDAIMLVDLSNAIILHENGMQPYPRANMMEIARKLTASNCLEEDL